MRGRPMGNKAFSITVDDETARRLQSRVADRGVTVPELVAELAACDAQPVTVEDDELTDLERVLARAVAPGGTVPHAEVTDWLKTWGTPDYRPWKSR